MSNGKTMVGSRVRGGMFDPFLSKAGSRKTRSISPPLAPISTDDLPDLTSTEPELPSPKQRLRSRRVNRCILGAPDHKETDRWLREKIRERRDAQSREWNFDFECDAPGSDPDSPWAWSVSQMEDPSFYTRHPSPPPSPRRSVRIYNLRHPKKSFHQASTSASATSSHQNHGDQIMPEIDSDLPQELQQPPADVQRVPDLPVLSESEHEHHFQAEVSVSCPSMSCSDSSVDGKKVFGKVVEKKPVDSSAKKSSGTSPILRSSKRRSIRIDVEEGTRKNAKITGVTYVNQAQNSSSAYFRVFPCAKESTSSSEKMFALR